MIVRKLILLVAIVAVFASLVTSAAFAQEASDEVAPENARATVVVLVDQSGSLNEQDLAEEVRAIRMLTDVPGIDLHVVGFASQGTLAAWEVFCGPDDVPETCTDAISLRTNAQGNDTDHAAALAGANFVLNRPDVSDTGAKIVLMMTDGRFDPKGSGADSEDWARLDQAQDRLSATGAEVWPLGFGEANPEDLDKLATPSPASCEQPRGVIVDTPDALLIAFNEIITSATCNPGFDGDRLPVPPGSQSITLWFLEDELPNGEVTVTNESGQSQTVACTLDELAGLWTCNIPTSQLGTGNWIVSPTPSLDPYVETGEPKPETPSTTVAPENTSTSLAALPAPPPPVVDDVPAKNSSFPRMLLIGGLLALGVLIWALLRNRSKLERGVVAVRMAGQSEWSPEETVRAEKRQAFEVDPDSGYPSIDATNQPVADVSLEATSKGIFVSGSMVEGRIRINIGEEIELIDGMTLIYVRTLDDDVDDELDVDEDVYEDSFI